MPEGQEGDQQFTSTKHKLGEATGSVQEAIDTLNKRNADMPEYDATVVEKKKEITALLARLESGEISRDEYLDVMARVLAENTVASDRDPLTRALKREAFLRQASKELKRANIYGTPLTIAMIDLDHFKRTNDTHGHAMGDEVLREVSEYFQNNTRPNDVFGRWGGEEFLLVLPNTPAQKAEAVLKRLMESMPKGIGGKVDVTASIGFTDSNTFLSDNIEDLIKKADEALYIAKGKDKPDNESNESRDRAVYVNKTGEVTTILPQRPPETPPQT